MHFTSSNLLHNFLNGKYMFKKKKKKIHVKITGQLDSTYSLIDPNPFLTCLK